MDPDTYEIAARLRDCFSQLAEDMNEIAQRGIKKSDQEESARNVKVPESTFNLPFQDREGERLGKYGTAIKKDSPPELYQKAFNVLKQTSSTIDQRYTFNNYNYSYWLYQDVIYRQSRKKVDEKPEAGKPVVEKKAEKKSKPAQPASPTSYNDSQINYRYNERKFGPKTVASDIAFPNNNENNPTFDSMLQSLKTRKAAGEKIKPYWLFTDGSGFGKNIEKS